jgi:metallo-beta-lactamase family protein
MDVTFLGAAGTVTGSKFLLETESTRILVDCGLSADTLRRRIAEWGLAVRVPEYRERVTLER